MKLELTLEPFAAFTKYAVKANSLRDFLENYFDADFYNRSKDELYDMFRKDIESNGFAFIPDMYSQTGEIVSYYGKI